MKITRGLIGSRLARRIVALFMFCALIPIGTMAALSYDQVRKLLIDQSYAHLAQLNSSYASGLYERLLTANQQMRGLGATVNVDRPAWSDELKESLRDQFVAIAIVAPGGATTTLLDGERPLPRLEDAQFNDLAKGETVLVTADAENSTRIVLVRALDRTHLNAGALVAEIDPLYLWNDRDALPALTEFCVADPQGRLLFCSEAPPPELREFAARLPHAPNGRFTFSHNGTRQVAIHRELFFGSRFTTGGWTVIATRPEEDMLAPVATFRASFPLTMVLALLAVALMSMSQVRRTLVPLGKLIDGTRRAANKDFSARVDVAGSDEFAELAKSFNTMTARLGTQFTALSTLADIDRAILSRLDVEYVIEAVMRRIHDMVSADCVSIAILDRDAVGTMRVYSSCHGNPSRMELQRGTSTVEDTRDLLLHPEGAWLDASQLTKSYAAPVASLGATAQFGLPIIWQGAIVGTLVLGFEHDRELADDERLRSRDLADRIGVAFAAAARDEQLYFQAHYDPLTELPNRLYFKDQLSRTLAQAQRDRQRFALLYIDLDYFKRVNDSIGHAAGDDVLREAAKRLRRCVREADVVARLGGDEFTVIVSDIRTAHDPQVVADKVIAAMSVPFICAGHEHFLSASVGIVVHPADGSTADELLRNADTAMYRAKESGRGKSVYFEEGMNATALARVRSESDLRHAIERREFMLVYQPLVDVVTGVTSGAEALIRWNHPERGVLAPAHFILLAEETGLIDPMGEWVMHEACTQYRALRDRGVALSHMAVNVSAREFRQEDLADRVEEILRASGMPPSALEIEITESLLLDATPGIEKILERLNRIGVRIALDDFGTGYSSLAYLKRYPVHIVKIDRAFVKDLPADDSSAAIASAIISMARALNKEVVAEGVETLEQAKFLRGLGCDRLQGYYLSEPLSALELERFVRRGPILPT